MIHCTDYAESILDSDLCFVLRLMKNVTYATPLIAQINFQKCMLQYNDDSEYNQINFILLSVRKMHTEV